MPNIMPLEDLSNYGEVLREVAPGKPVFLIRNGRGRHVVMDIGDWDRAWAARTLVAELDRSRVSATEGKRSLAEVRAHLADLASDAKTSS